MTVGNRIKPLLNVRNLRAWLPTDRGVVKAVDNVSFSLQQGRTLGLVGESGCGKSMLAKAIMGLLPSNAQIPSDAAVEFAGRDLVRIPRKELRRIIGKEISLVFQDPMTSLNPVMTVGRQVAEVVRYHLRVGRQEARQRAIALLDMVGIPMPEGRAVQYPHQLSGGLRQRVAIAIALACEPKLLIADEPTTALDVTVQAAILDLLSELQQDRQMAMILITHDLGVVAGRTHEAAVMYAGKFVEQASTEALFNCVRMPYTHALMAAIPRLENPSHTELKAIDGQPPDLIDLPQGCRFAPRCWKALPMCNQLEPELKPVHDNGHRSACWYPLGGE